MNGVDGRKKADMVVAGFAFVKNIRDWMMYGPASRRVDRTCKWCPTAASPIDVYVEHAPSPRLYAQMQGLSDRLGPGALREYINSHPIIFGDLEREHGVDMGPCELRTCDDFLNSAPPQPWSFIQRVSVTMFVGAFCAFGLVMAGTVFVYLGNVPKNTDVIDAVAAWAAACGGLLGVGLGIRNHWKASAALAHRATHWKDAQAKVRSALDRPAKALAMAFDRHTAYLEIVIHDLRFTPAFKCLPPNYQRVLVAALNLSRSSEQSGVLEGSLIEPFVPDAAVAPATIAPTRRSSVDHGTAQVTAALAALLPNPKKYPADRPIFDMFDPEDTVPSQPATPARPTPPQPVCLLELD